MNQVRPDDIYDVLDISKEIQQKIYDILADYPMFIGMPSLNLAIFQLMFHKDNQKLTKYYVENFCKGLLELMEENI